LVDFPTIANVAYADVKGYADFMRPLVTPWLQQATMVLLDPSQNDVERDIDAGTTTVTVTPLWAGRCRIQPIKDVLDLKTTLNDTTVRTVQVWPYWLEDDFTIDLKPGLELVCIDGYNDPQLVNYQYIVTGAMNSSMGWQRTIKCRVNMENRPDYDWGNWDLSTWLG